MDLILVMIFVKYVEVQGIYNYYYMSILLLLLLLLLLLFKK